MLRQKNIQKSVVRSRKVIRSKKAFEIDPVMVAVAFGILLVMLILYMSWMHKGQGIFSWLFRST